MDPHRVVKSRFAAAPTSARCVDTDCLACVHVEAGVPPLVWAPALHTAVALNKIALQTAIGFVDLTVPYPK